MKNKKNTINFSGNQSTSSDKKRMDMINYFKRYIAMALVIGLILSVAFVPVTSYAQGNVKYEGQSEGFIFEPGSKDTPTDLFPNFKDVVPGDEVTDSVEIKNNSAEGKTVNLYMRALGGDEAGEALLSQINLSVNLAEGEIFNAPSNETAGLTEWTLLGTLAKGESAVLDVTIKVPLTVGNELQNAKGFIEWEFKVEEVDEDDPPKDDPPKDDPPKDDPPKDDPPKDDPPKDDPPKDDSPNDDPPKDDPPADDPPADDPPADNPPADDPPADDTPKEDPPKKETPKPEKSPKTGDDAPLKELIVLFGIAGMTTITTAGVHRRLKSKKN